MIPMISADFRSLKLLPLLFCFVVLVSFSLGIGTAQALNWNGENGLVRFSFDEGEPITNIHHQKTEDGVTKITLVAWLTDVDPVVINGTAFDELGGFELSLKITGAQAFILNQKIAAKGLNVSKDTGSFIAGLAFGMPLVQGQTALASWEIMFQGEVKDVMFSLDPEGLFSCKGTAGCVENGSQCIYIGGEKGHMLTEMFSAGFQPAWLNPSGDPDVTPVTGTSSWEDVGRSKKSEPKKQ